MTNLSSGVVFIILRDNKVLMQLRDENSLAYKNRWCFPGGGSDKDEQPKETLVREVKEEYGLNIVFENCIYLMTRKHGRNNRVFVCPIDNTQEPVLYEGADMKWMTIEEVKDIDIGFEQGDVIKALDNYLQQLS